MTIEDTFAFIIHPIDPKNDVARKYPLLGKLLTEGQINYFSRFFPPVYISEITGVRSAATGKELRGWFIACPYTPKTMLESARRSGLPARSSRAGTWPKRLGARLLGLGAYTSVVGDAGETIAAAAGSARHERRRLYRLHGDRSGARGGALHGHRDERAHRRRSSARPA